MKFAHNTTVVGLISNNDETHYRHEVQHLAEWCSDNNLVLNPTKTKEVTVLRDPGRPHPLHSTLSGEEEEERVNSIKFLGRHITKDLTWSLNTSHLVKKSQQRFYFLRKLKQAGLPP